MFALVCICPVEEELGRVATLALFLAGRILQGGVDDDSHTRVFVTTELTLGVLATLENL